MIRHILLFSLHPDADPQACQLMIDRFNKFPEIFPQMMNWEFGLNQSKRDKTFLYAMVVNFRTMDDANSYLNSEEHERFVAVEFRPLMAQRAIATFEVGT